MVLSMYRHEHKQKYKEVFDTIKKIYLYKTFTQHMELLSMIDNDIERNCALQNFYQWMADNRLIRVNITLRYTEVILVNPIGDRSVLYKTISCVYDDATEDLTWSPKFSTKIVDSDETSSDEDDYFAHLGFKVSKYMDCDIWIDVPERTPHNICIRLNREDLE